MEITDINSGKDKLTSLYASSLHVYVKDTKSSMLNQGMVAQMAERAAMNSKVPSLSPRLGSYETCFKE